MAGAKRRLAARALCLCTLLLVTAATGADFTVTNTASLGPGSLRQALTAANLLPGADRIQFALPGEGPWIIAPTLPLPLVVDPLLLDGGSQPGFDGMPLVALDGSMTPPGTDGLVLQTTNCLVARLAIHGFPGAGLRVLGGGGHLFQGNVLGATPDGQQARPNDVGLLLQESFLNTIGGGTPGEGNLASGNRSWGIRLVGGAASVIMGNLIGLGSDGASPLPNGAGLEVSGEGHTVGGLSVAAANVVSGNHQHGVVLEGRGHVVQGNLIGLNSTGDGAVGNGGSGLTILSGEAVTVGGTEAGAANLVSGNQGPGLVLQGPGTRFNVVQGNLVGLSRAGARFLPNAGHGLDLRNGASVNTIGGTEAGAGNVLSGNGGAGVALGGEPAATNNVIQGNLIGRTATQDRAGGNRAGGIWLHGLARDNLIGGLGEEAGNTILGNRRHGIHLGEGSGLGGNTLLGNSISQNGGLGIRFDHAAGNPAGSQPNDPADADEGPNGLQNHPVLTNVVAMEGVIFLAGYLESRPLRDYQVEIFANPTVDPSGFGEGSLLVHRFFVTTNTDGMAEIRQLWSGDPGPGFFTATATDAQSGDTSEFGPYVALPGALQITGVRREQGRTEVAFTTRRGMGYRLHWSPSVAGAPDVVAVLESGGGGIDTLIHSSAMLEPAGFYWVSEKPLP